MLKLQESSGFNSLVSRKPQPFYSNLCSVRPYECQFIQKQFFTSMHGLDFKAQISINYLQGNLKAICYTVSWLVLFISLFDCPRYLFVCRMCKTLQRTLLSRYGGWARFILSHSKAQTLCLLSRKFYFIHCELIFCLHIPKSLHNCHLFSPYIFT